MSLTTTLSHAHLRNHFHACAFVTGPAVVDDNADLAELLSDALQGEGFQTSVAHDGRGALTTWRRFLPHAGVLDVGLPDLDGYELAKALRAEHGKDATLIAATGYGQPADRSRAQEAGFDCHLVKPVSIHVLVLDERIVSASDGLARDGHSSR